MTILLSASCSPAAWRAAWAAATRRASASAAPPSWSACWRGSRRNASASSSMPMAIRRASPIPACPWLPTACRILPARSPAFSPGSIGRRPTRRDCQWLLSVPGDCPFLPKDLVARLHAARVAAGAPLACARSGEWRHPVVGLWPVALREDLRRALGRRRPAQDRNLDRAPRRRDCRLAGRAGRSVLQRQHAGGCGARASNRHAISGTRQDPRPG